MKPINVTVELKGDELKKKLNIKDGRDGIDGKDGKDAEPIDIQEILNKIPSPEEVAKAFPFFDEKVIKALQKDDVISIDAIKNLREELSKTTERKVTGLNKRLWQLIDMNLDGLTTDQSIKWNGSQWIPYTPSAGAVAFTDLTDTFPSYTGLAGQGLRVNATADGIDTYTAVDTDEKVKLNASDPTAGYLDDKITGYGFLTAETDPIYTSSSWYSTTNNASNWDTAYSWGNHALAGYLTAETDPVFSAWLGTSPLSGYAKLDGSNHPFTFVKTPKIYPASDSTTALQILKADGTTSIMNFDTTNGRVGIGTTPSYPLHLVTTSNSPAYFQSSDTNTVTIRSTKGSSLATAQVGLVTPTRSLYFASTDQAGGLFGLYDGNASAWRMAIIHGTGNVVFGGGISAPTKLTLSSGQLSVPLGSVASPSYTFAGDLNTGIYSTGADALAFSTAGTARMQISATGSFALGATTPLDAISFRLIKSATQYTSGQTGIYVEGRHTLNADNAFAWRGIYSGPSVDQAGFNGTASTPNGGSIPAFYALPQAVGASGSVTNVTAYFSSPRNTGAGTVLNLMGFQAGVGLNTGGGTVTNNYGFYTADQAVGTNNYGFYSTLTAGTGKWALYLAGSAQSYIAGNLGIGTAAISAKAHIISTTEQLRVGYDTSNYFSTTVSSAGAVTFNAVGASAGFTFSDAITASYKSSDGSAGLSATYNFDATTSGNITSMTFKDGLLTAVTTLP